MNSGDTAWLLTSTALVLLMTPALAFFYGGMVRRKNLLSTIMMSFAILCLISILWILYGYTMAFGPDVKGLVGDLSWFGLTGVGQGPSPIYASTVPQLAFVAFQATFAIITVALWTGAVVERIKFGALLAFAALWFTFIYCPVAHWVWGSGGWLAQLGALDFAGGTVVHVNAGISALALALVLGPRMGFKEGESMEPNNIPYVVLGAALLWFGWFGFNAGSALTAGGIASNAFITTNTAAAAAGFTWMILGWIHRRPSVLGAATGAVVGLVAITPAAGFVPVWAAIPIGAIGAAISYYVMVWRARSSGVDESLDVFACHGMGGTWGALATGIFATTAVNTAGSGLIDGNWKQVLIQIAAIVATAAYAFVVSWLLAKALKATMGLRVKEEEEAVGLDISQHGERAYGGVS
ncbi:MAG: ammonium transporter [Dehalococcoidia bacterium]|nr:ammonium transporter [Dehalococcoidia bacterium]MDD5647692.1 ammonium transporter [Dehalococcoidia bacterium]